MSRLHEALKNVQEQRTSGSPLQPSPGTVETGISDVIHNGKSARRAPEILAAVRSEGSAIKAESVSTQEEQTSATGPLQFDDLLQRCTKATWKPKAQWSVFSSERPAEREAKQFRTLRAHLYNLRE